MEKLIDKIYQEREKISQEMENAQADGNSDLETLVGWEEALKWVIRQIKKEGGGK